MARRWIILVSVTWSSLRDRVALITGASSGIGAATARALAAEGMAVVLAARRLDRLRGVAADIHRDGGRAHPVEADVTSDEDVDRMIAETLGVFGRLDVAVCNAGVGFHGSLEDTSPDAMARVMDVNFMGTFLVARAALPHLKRQSEARLIVVSSIVGKRGIPWGGAYSATKFAQVGLVEALRPELASTGVRVSVVLPVSTETEFRDAMACEQGFAVAGHGPRQPAERVASAIVRTVKRPRPEVYPYAPSRLLIVLNALAPGVSDRIIRRFGRKPI
jgi:NAD(P)-dependent dehydrogenase (short-subunit alcohol dehydrogenase family)